MAETVSRHTPEVASAIQSYLDDLGVALASARAQERDDALCDAAEYFDERLDGTAGTAEFAEIAAELGDPARFAADILSALGRRGPRDVALAAPLAPERHQTRWAGKVLGVPFDVRVPNSSRIAARWWDPRNPAVFVPRVFGLGWDINFGAVAVGLGLIRPDDEEESFAAVPDGVFYRALLVPVAFTAAILVLAVFTSGRTPGLLPVHWNVRGVPDRFWPTSMVVLFNLMLAAVPTVYAAYSVAKRQRPLYRAASIALASMMAALAAGTFLLSVLWGLGVETPLLFPPVILAAVCLPLVELTVFARIGRAAEWRRDLGPGTRRG